VLYLDQEFLVALVNQECLVLFLVAVMFLVLFLVAVMFLD
tara:strand:- start:7 stop:126 length:120 start_codon:yes stop_codon:yes gene_type:complete